MIDYELCPEGGEAYASTRSEELMLTQATHKCEVDHDHGQRIGRGRGST